MERPCQNPNCKCTFTEYQFRRSGGRQKFCSVRCEREAYRVHRPHRPAVRKWHCGDPANSERLYDEEETEFIKAVDRWRREHGGKIPTCCDLLAIARGLGYRKT